MAYIKVEDIVYYDGRIVNGCSVCGGVVFWDDDEGGGFCIRCGEEHEIIYGRQNGERNQANTTRV